MKKKSIAVAIAVVLLMQVFCISALAAPATFTFTMNRADLSVTVSGEGFAPNQMLSLMAAYKAAPSLAEPANLDYLNQLVADADGKVNFTFKTKMKQGTGGAVGGTGGWLGGESYFVSLGGALVSKVIESSVVKIDGNSSFSIRKGTTKQINLITDGISFSYSSSNPTVATVSKTGLVGGVKAGMAVITIKALDGSGLTTQVLVTVTM